MDLKKIKHKFIEIYKSKKKLMLIGSGVLVLAIAAAIFFTARSASVNQETAVQYVKATTGSLTESIDVVGTLEAQPMVKLAWESGGIISPFTLKIGDRVKKGDVLFSLEEGSLSASILQAQTDLLDAKAALDNLNSANTDLYTASKTLSDAEYTLRRYDTNRDYWNVKGSSWDAIEKSRADYYAAKQVVYEKDSAYKAFSGTDSDETKKAAAYKDYQDAVAAREKALRVLNNLLGTYYTYAADTDFILYDQAEAAVEEARIDYNRYLDQTDEIAAAEANVQALENTINQSKIIAPFDGTVTDISAVSGQIVSSGDTAVRIDNLDNLVVKVEVSEVDINKISESQKAIVTFDALPEKDYEGQMSLISSAGSNASGVVEFSVTVKVLNADTNVKPGFTAVVSIITSNVENALLVPNGAIVSRDGSSAVILVGSDKSTTIVPVETGASSDTYTEIKTDKIAEGDRLAVYSSISSSEVPEMRGLGLMGGGGASSQNKSPQVEPPQQ
jgi:HlyD family secretion protein